MIVETSAIISILMKEPGFETLILKMSLVIERYCSMASYVETTMSLTGKRGTYAGAELDRWLLDSRIILVPVDLRQVSFAREGFQRFGKGRHPAKLNLGDCFAYGLAKDFDMPLLYVGNDFSQTDIVAA